MTDPSTSIVFDPVTNPDAQEALSIKYGNGGIVVIPLTSGALAIFDRSFSLKEIIDDPTNGLFAQYSFAFKHALMNKTQEARFYGEPDNETFKRDMQAKRRLEAKVERENANRVDTSDFAF